nr:SIS domain-containing protein [Candidatus Prometheoarchaeum syntrophicum]QEE17903.1 Glutamine--fructose-6-phosphate aminotransferase (isomerizing) [Candidatus Prometheoarchaeum syntrophicum]
MENKNEIILGEKTLKEIWEIPKSIEKSISKVKNREKIKEIAKKIVDSNCVSMYILASGTSYHAGLVSTYWFSQYAKYPAHCELAPEFPYLVEPIIAKKHCVICISQSGESELTVLSAKKSLEAGAFVISITNDSESTLAKITGENTILTTAGIEESVLATKTYVCQLAVLAALTLDLGFYRKTLEEKLYYDLWDELETLPKLIETILPKYRDDIQKIAPFFKFGTKAFTIGAGPDYPNCMEAALKLKEGAQIFAQAFSTAEYVHGPVTLASPYTFVLTIIPRPAIKMRHDDVIKLIHRLKNRGVTVLGIKNANDNIEELDISIDIPECNDSFAPILSIIPIQLLTVEIATIKNINCDTPKFLSKISKL